MLTAVTAWVAVGAASFGDDVLIFPAKYSILYS